MSIIKLLNKKIDRITFTTPSHNQKPVFSDNLESFYKHDFSELVGFDNLSNPKNSILMAQGKVSDCLKTKQSFFVVQGATTALLAAMKALINPGDRVLAARNCHKTVFNGLILTAGIVDWFIPETDSDWGIYTTIDPKKLEQTLELNDYKVFIMTSPTYEGVNSDIKKIASICANHNTYLIVDESHGSLYNFSDKLPSSAIVQGADVSVNSLHKTAGALNQCALLNISANIKNIDTQLFQKALNIFQTTSPSYPLLENIESCISYLSSNKGKKEIDKLLKNIEKFKNQLKNKGIEFYEAQNHDPTKILLKKEGTGGFSLSNQLFDNYNIEDEMSNPFCVLCLAGIGTTKQKLDKLKTALKKITPDSKFEAPTANFQPYPIVKIQPVKTFNQEYIYINKNDSVNRISNGLILPYPPGIGLLYPGEAIQKWHLDYLNNDVEVIV